MRAREAVEVRASEWRAYGQATEQATTVIAILLKASR